VQTERKINGIYTHAASDVDRNEKKAKHLQNNQSLSRN